MSPSSDDSKTQEPAKKKAKLETTVTTEAKAAKVKQQSSLSSFFAPKKKAEPKKPPNDVDSKPASTNAVVKTTPLPTQHESNAASSSAEAIVPTQVPPSSATWQSLHNSFVLIRKPRLKAFSDSVHRQKVAAFDMDGTLVNWIGDFWPSKLAHYELWNSSVITKMQHLYDNENYLLVIFTNQGGIQGAHTGKKAQLLKSIIDWLESLVQRPLIVVSSTKSLKKYKDQSFHKPTPKMWDKVFKPYFGKKSAPFDVASSFFVGDSADENDAQGGVDKKFAQTAGGGLGAFYTPEEFFGPSHQTLRERRSSLGGGGDNDTAVPTVPAAALESRKALLGGYDLSGLSDEDDLSDISEEKNAPILILLVGVQGSGKSTFCHHVLHGMSVEELYEAEDEAWNNLNSNWVWLSQDTINNGRPGRREQVEDEACKALEEGNSVLIDRMHLTPEQRQDMIERVTFCTEEKVHVHVVVLNPSKDTIAQRVKNRTNHPGKVEGEKGARIAMMSLQRFVQPTYEEKELDLISYASTGFAAKQLALRYHLQYHQNNMAIQLAKSVPAASLSSEISIPTLSLGTMKIGRKVCTESVQKMVDVGFRSIDTAPTYKNEDKVGEALRANSNGNEIFVIAKVPKRATTANEVRDEFQKTLDQLRKSSVDLLLLHWPSDVIAQNTLSEVWACMEELVKEKKCKALGVCNFNEGALTRLLKCCTIPPVVNQVERHPLLPQFPLLEFCTRHNIWMQAHTPLGGSQGNDKILKHPIVEQVANETGLTPAQVVVQWNLKQGVLVVTKCSQESHAREILDCTGDDARTKLSPEHMRSLDNLVNKDTKPIRFIAPPFMYGTKAVYYWGERMPRL